MAQKTFVDGDVLTASDINTYLMGEGGAWTSWTPTIGQGATSNIAKTVTYSKYARYGRTIIWNFSLLVTGTGTAGAAVTVTTPIEGVAAVAIGGSGFIYDSSTTTRYAGFFEGAAATTAVSLVTDATGVNRWGTAPSIALGNNDVITGSITYEAAS